ncbi:hypothetical protein ACE4RU_02820 [Actinobacillus seminis]|uniref:hypothetical protein n=1 Tax=Actinobacillus seminis TaxID=722 RepID=UPI003B92940F
MFLNYFKQILNENIEGDGEGWTIIDVFGGSGLLAHTTKHEKPLARVIYNDFDDYAERLKHIKETNQLRQEIFKIVDGIIPKNKRISNEVKAEIINKINKFQGFKDLKCLSSWLLFSGKQVATLDDLFGYEFWHSVRQTDYPEANSYLDGLEIICESFHTLLPRFSHDSKVLFVLDPPYLCTRQESYKQDRYFDLIDFLRLINITRPPYIFFSSTKSEFIRFIEYMQEDKAHNWKAFEGSKRIGVNAQICYSKKYEDHLVYKF